MTRSLLRRFFGISHSIKRPGASPYARPRIESLEPRMALATLHVGSDPGEFTTIQAAVDAAHTGDTIRVEPGTYVEQVTVSNVGHNRDHLKIIGSSRASIIQAPAVLSGDKAIVQIEASQNVTIEKFTVQGPGSGPCDSIRWGIRIEGGGSASIVDNHITEIRDNPLGGCQNGIGILVGRQFEGETGSATISKNTIDNYQKGGIVVDNAGSSAQISKNTLAGIGPTNLIAQNGIQISRGATGVVSQNQVSGHLYSPQTFASTGVLLFQPGAVTLTKNTITNNDVGIYSIIASDILISHNIVSGSTFNGIALDTTSASRVVHNTTSNNGSGVSGDSGIGLYASTNNTIEHNTSRNNNGSGIFVDADSIDNLLSHNDLRGNSDFDAVDKSVGTGTAGTGNTWKKNKGGSSSPPGLVS